MPEPVVDAPAGLPKRPFPSIDDRNMGAGAPGQDWVGFWIGRSKLMYSFIEAAGRCAKTEGNATVKSA